MSGKIYGMLLSSKYKALQEPISVFWLWSLLSALCIWVGVLAEQWWLLLLPPSIFLVIFTVLDFRFLYYLLFLSLPFSLEYYLPNGLGTDLPTEPLMWLITGVALMLFTKNIGSIKIDYFKNPITYLLLLHLAWIFFTCFISLDFTRSLKFFIAKIWYVVPFYFLFVGLIKDEKFLKRILYILMWGLLIALIYVLIRHAQFDFSFKSSNTVVRPIFRNHVSYAAILVVFLPYLLVIRNITTSSFLTKIIPGIALLFVIAIYFSYTRAAIASIGIAVGAYYIIERRLVKATLLSASVITVVLMGFLIHNNNYLRFAPQYERTITHHKFDNLLEATYKLEDISTMERVYRWVAGVEMVADRPLTGFGPGTFYNFYKSYTVTSFQTYVSDNPDQSGVHNYFLMTFIEQGLPGFLIFIALCFAVLIYGERIYHLANQSVDKSMIMSALLSFIIILAMLLINDLVETDKVGSFFFMNIAIICFFVWRYTNNNRHQQIKSSI